MGSKGNESEYQREFEKGKRLGEVIGRFIGIGLIVWGFNKLFGKSKNPIVEESEEERLRRWEEDWYC